MSFIHDDQFRAAMERFDQANARDPNTTDVDGTAWPKELAYARRMTHWLHRLEPNPSEPLELAARSQHLLRWSIPRERYPKDRAGYLRWRTALQAFHAEQAAEILRQIGYDEPTVSRVGSLIRKEKIKADAEMQLLEDVICLVFLENYFAEFAQDQDEPKLIRILQKTWKKMSPRGHAAAKALELPERERMLIEKASPAPPPLSDSHAAFPPHRAPRAHPPSSTGDSTDPQ